MIIRPRLLAVGLIASAALPVRSLAEPPSAPSVFRGFKVSFDTALQTEPYTGRVYVFVSKRLNGEPRRGLSWTRPPAVFAVDLEKWNPAEPLTIDGKGIAFPRPLSELPPEKYSIQAVARRSLEHPVPGEGPGDLFSPATVETIGGGEREWIELKLDQVVRPRDLPEERERVRFVEIHSRLLTAFHGRPMKLRAGIRLPAGWKEDDAQTYPTLYFFTGFGGDHRMAAHLPMMAGGAGVGDLGDRVLFVVPDATCFYGHSVFADSATNGPWGKALMEELIPHIERKFHGAAGGERRFAAGISSGGWTALWLQVRYPDDFNGCFAHCPDPVDFRDFQRINLYAEGANMYVDDKGARRPLMRDGDRVVLWYEDFIRMEEALGPGGQLRSFEACFSRRGPDGKPEQLWDRASGKVNPAVARSWEPFDIRLVLERNWPMLGPKLRGKLHVYAGGRDTFYLDGAVALLKESLQKLGSDAEVVIYTEEAHGLIGEQVAPMYRRIVGNGRGEE